VIQFARSASYAVRLRREGVPPAGPNSRGDWDCVLSLARGVDSSSKLNGAGELSTRSEHAIWDQGTTIS